MTTLISSNDRLHIIKRVVSENNSLEAVEGFSINNTEENIDLLKAGFRAANVEDIFNHIDMDDSSVFANWVTMIKSFKTTSNLTLLNESLKPKKANDINFEIRATYEHDIKTIKFEVTAIGKYLEAAKYTLSEDDLIDIKKEIEEITKHIIDLASLARIELNCVKSLEVK